MLNVQGSDYVSSGNYHLSHPRDHLPKSSFFVVARIATRTSHVPFAARSRFSRLPGGEGRL